jgi:hypothetical protein
MTLFELLRKHARRVIEYVALDLEGSEYDVLRKFPFEEYTIMALSIEGDACSKLLLARGYKEVANKFNTEAPWEHYFVHQDFQEETRQIETRLIVLRVLIRAGRHIRACIVRALRRNGHVRRQSAWQDGHNDGRVLG